MNIKMYHFTWEKIDSNGDKLSYSIYSLDNIHDKLSDQHKTSLINCEVCNLPGKGKTIYSVVITPNNIRNRYIMGDSKESAVENASRYYQRFDCDNVEIYKILVQDVVELNVLKHTIVKFQPTKCSNCCEYVGYGQSHVTDTCGGLDWKYTCSLPSSSLYGKSYNEWYADQCARDW
jgi:hypothetical protein